MVISYFIMILFKLHGMWKTLRYLRFWTGAVRLVILVPHSPLPTFLPPTFCLASLYNKDTTDIVGCDKGTCTAEGWQRLTDLSACHASHGPSEARPVWALIWQHNSIGLCFSLAEIHTALQSKACYFPGASKYDCTALLSAILDIQLKIDMGNN